MPDIESAWPRYPDYRIDLVPCRGRAVVRVDGEVVADSRRALRLIETDHVERLYFPQEDVRLEALAGNDHTTVCPFKGLATYWSHPSVEDVFWTYREPFAEVAGIAGFLGVWHEKDGVAVSIESSWPDGTSATATFPAWGDQDDLLRLLDAQPVGPTLYSAPGYHVRTRNVVEGGQLLGQAIVAASKACPDKRVSWASAVFARAAGFQAPVELSVEELRAGRTFTTLAVRSTQGGRLVAPSTVLLDAGAPDVVRHVTAMPAVAKPADSEPYDMGVIGRDLRVVNGAYSGDPSRRGGPPELHVWMRFRDNPAEPSLRQALIAQATTHWTIAAAMRPHDGMGEDRAHADLSTGPMALSVAFHDDVPLDQWLLYSTVATSAGLGLTYGEGRILTEDGTAVASYSLQAMVRDLLPGAAGKDPSEAM